jgi:hypothetical protein
MPAICDVHTSIRRKGYLVADQSLLVETRDDWSAGVIDQLFAGWYLTESTRVLSQAVPDIVITGSAVPPNLPDDPHHFEIAGGGTCYNDGRAFYIEIGGSVIAIDGGRSPVEVSANGPLEVTSPELTRIVTYALSAALRRHSLFELHSGAVIEPTTGHGVLIIGPSGSGKSTLTVQLAEAGWPFLTDDVLLLSRQRGDVVAWPLRRCFAITAETFTASNFLRTRTSLDYSNAQREDKKQFVPHSVFASEFKESCMVRTMFFSEIRGDEQSTVQRLSASDAMARLIRMNPWSCYDRATAADHLSALAALAKQSAAFELRAGKDLLEATVAASVIGRWTTV